MAAVFSTGNVGSGPINYGKGSHKLLSEYQSLRKRYWGQHLWAREYWVCSSGNVTDEVWNEYIKAQKPPEPGAIRNGEPFKELDLPPAFSTFFVA